MSETHTPGPWKALDGQYNKGCIMAVNGGVVSDDPNCSLANARLMAAAPELLAALRHAADMIPAPSANMNCHSGICSAEKCSRCSRSALIRAAIAKAEGRS